MNWVFKVFGGECWIGRGKLHTSLEFLGWELDMKLRLDSRREYQMLCDTQLETILLPTIVERRIAEASAVDGPTIH